MDPIVAATYPIPKSAILPLILLIFGLGEASKIVMVAIGVFYPDAHQHDGRRARDHRRSTSTWRRISARSRCRSSARSRCPARMPLIMTGVKLGVGMGLILIALAEMIGAKSGLGYMMWNAWEMLSVETMYVGLIVIAAAGRPFHAHPQRDRAFACAVEAGAISQNARTNYGGRSQAMTVEEKTGASGAYSAFAFRDFRYWIAYRYLSGVAHQMRAVAIGWYLYELTGSAVALGLAGLASSPPSLVFALVTGHVADTYNRSWVVVISFGVCAVAMLALTLAIVAGSPPLWLIYLARGGDRRSAAPSAIRPRRRSRPTLCPRKISPTR